MSFIKELARLEFILWWGGGKINVMNLRYGWSPARSFEDTNGVKRLFSDHLLDVFGAKKKKKKQ